MLHYLLSLFVSILLYTLAIKATQNRFNLHGQKVVEHLKDLDGWQPALPIEQVMAPPVIVTRTVETWETKIVVIKRSEYERLKGGGSFDKDF